MLTCSRHHKTSAQAWRNRVSNLSGLGQSTGSEFFEQFGPVAGEEQTVRTDMTLGARLFRHLMALPIQYFGVRRVYFKRLCPR